LSTRLKITSLKNKNKYLVNFNDSIGTSQAGNLSNTDAEYGNSAGEGCRGRLPDKAAGQGCRARLLSKAAGQGCRVRLPGKAAGQGSTAESMHGRVKLDNKIPTITTTTKQNLDPRRVKARRG
jgi:hypothetical protein